MAEVFLIFLRLGLTSFGGPVAHIGYFHDEFVVRKKWIDEKAYAELVALCQLLPGPASSQVGMAIGLGRAGYGGAIAACLGFTLPSALILVVFAIGVVNFELSNSWLHGLKIVAVAVVAQAVYTMAIKLCPDVKRASLAVAAAFLMNVFPSVISQLIVMVLGGAFGMLFLNPPGFEERKLPLAPVSRRVGIIFLACFVGLLTGLPFAVKMSGSPVLDLVDSFFRAGSLVFGGGHVVLPLLHAEVVPPGWVTNEFFMAGYAAAQAIPGPLFAFSAYLGAGAQTPVAGWLGAIICLVAAFLPSFLLVIGVQPFWLKLRQSPKFQCALMGINAVVVGLLMAAFYDPVWTSAIFSLKDLALAVFGFLLLMLVKAPSWFVVLLCALAGYIFL